jgi:hypothetical protein
VGPARARGGGDDALGLSGEPLAKIFRRDIEYRAARLDAVPPVTPDDGQGHGRSDRERLHRVVLGDDHRDDARRVRAVDEPLALTAAREVAEEMLTAHPELSEKHLQRWLGSREELLKS